MQFITGNEAFADNVKQLIPNTTIFDKMILDLPVNNKGIFWDQDENLDGKLTSGTTNKIFRSCYYLYLEKHPNLTEGDHPFDLTVNNIYANNLDISDKFDSWAIVQVSSNTYLFFIWIDLEQSFKLEWTNKDVNDWFLQVVI